MEYDIRANEYSEAWDIVELLKERYENILIATFYDYEKARAYWYLLNSLYSNCK